MATPTHVLLYTTTLTSTASSVVISSVSQSYRDLILIINRPTSKSSSSIIQFNNDTSTGSYRWQRVYGDGGSISAATFNNSNILFDENATQANANQVIEIMDYTSTAKHKIILVRSNSASNATIMLAGLWKSTAAISTINLLNDGLTYPSGTTFSLYGVA